MNRRHFVKQAVYSAAGFCAINTITRCGSKGKPLFTFVQLNDTHIHVPENKAYEKDSQKLEYVLDSINNETLFPLPDFVILVGDIIHGGKLEYLLPECQLAKKMLSKLKCPYYPVIGNHEVIQREGMPEFQNPYESVFGKDRVYYSFIHKGVLFICLNNSNGLGSYDVDFDLLDHELIDKARGLVRFLKSRKGDEIARRRNQWLKDVLAENPKLPKIIACHIPLIPLRDEAVLAESFGFVSYKMVGGNTLDIVENHKESVVAVLNGHLHLTGAVKKNGIYHISASGLASYPCHFTHYSVYRDRIDVKMIQVAKELVTPNTNIHGQRRHKRTFTDALHPTAEEYVSGNEMELQFTIPIPLGYLISAASQVGEVCTWNCSGRVSGGLAE